MVAGFCVAAVGLILAIVGWRLEHDRQDYGITSAASFTWKETGETDHGLIVNSDLTAQRSAASGIALDKDGNPMKSIPTTGRIFYGGKNGINVSYPDNVVRKTSDDQ